VKVGRQVHDRPALGISIHTGLDLRPMKSHAVRSFEHPVVISIRTGRGIPGERRVSCPFSRMYSFQSAPVLNSRPVKGPAGSGPPKRGGYFNPHRPVKAGESNRRHHGSHMGRISIRTGPERPAKGTRSTRYSRPALHFNPHRPEFQAGERSVPALPKCWSPTFQSAPAR